MTAPAPKMLAKQCQICNADYEVRASDYRRGWGKCCSKSCAATRREKILAMEALDKQRVDEEKATIARIFHHETIYDRNGEARYKPKVVSSGQVMDISFESLEKLYTWIRRNKKKVSWVTDVLVEDVLLGSDDRVGTDI